MNNTIKNPEPSPEQLVALNRIKGLAGEHFDHYLLVFMDKDGKEFHAYNNQVSGYGMASFIVSEINNKWWTK